MSLATVAALWQVEPDAVETLIRHGADGAVWEFGLHLDILRCMAVTQPDSSAWVDASTWRQFRERAAALALLAERAEVARKREEKRAGEQGQMRLLEDAA